MLSIIVVDFCAFRDIHKRFVVKELCISNVQSRQCHHWIFSTPDDILLDQTVNYERFHGLKVSDGTCNYYDLPSILKEYVSSCDFVFCKGLEKAFHIEKLIGDLRPVHDLSQFGAEPIKKIVKDLSHQTAGSCQHHSNIGTHYLDCAQIKSECLAESNGHLPTLADF